MIYAVFATFFYKAKRHMNNQTQRYLAFKIDLIFSSEIQMLASVEDLFCQKRYLQFAVLVALHPLTPLSEDVQLAPPAGTHTWVILSITPN